ncbi:YceI family protein [Flavobacterium gelatinilyticum]|uniref:YceI family protein n=1 Tax=Flavobacterium gelatinilyticum TaxID=3003260 RepID=UPI0024814E74|nr:YceI family protein [Flavobacterium gelatinilyticum]
MKRTTLLILLFTAFSLLAQNKFKTNSAIVNFEASVPFFEEVKAVNKLGIIILEPESSTLICTVVIKDFRFKMDLMQEHFNDNYIESHRYPKAVFKGKIEKFDLKQINETAQEYEVKGKLNIHGKTKLVTVKAIINRTPEGIHFSSNFPISVSDFDIEIPYVVANKISKTVQTDLTGIMK